MKQSLMGVLIEQRNSMEAKQFGRWFTANLKQLVSLEQVMHGNTAIMAVREFKEKLANAVTEEQVPEIIEVDQSAE